MSKTAAGTNRQMITVTNDAGKQVSTQSHSCHRRFLQLKERWERPLSQGTSLQPRNLDCRLPFDRLRGCSALVIEAHHRPAWPLQVGYDEADSGKTTPRSGTPLSPSHAAPSSSSWLGRESRCTRPSVCGSFLRLAASATPRERARSLLSTRVAGAVRQSAQAGVNQVAASHGLSLSNDRTSKTALVLKDIAHIPAE